MCAVPTAGQAPGDGGVGRAGGYHSACTWRVPMVYLSLRSGERWSTGLYRCRHRSIRGAGAVHAAPRDRQSRRIAQVASFSLTSDHAAVGFAALAVGGLMYGPFLPLKNTILQRTSPSGSLTSPAVSGEACWARVNAALRAACAAERPRVLPDHLQ